MSGMFRSAQMKYYQMYIPKEDAYNVVSKLANQNFVQFLDSAADNFHKPYVPQIRRCEEVISKIDLILKQIKKYEIPLPEIPLVERVFQIHKSIIQKKKISDSALLEEMEDQIEKTYTLLDSSIKSLATSERQAVDLDDYKYLLFKSREIFSGKVQSQSQSDVDFSKVSLEQLKLTNVSGVIFAKDMLKFSRMILRATKGNSVQYTFNIPNDYPSYEPRAAFVLILESGGNILTKINRICQSFYAKTYNIPITKEQIFDKIKQVEEAVNDTKQLVVMTQRKIKQDLTNAISTKDYEFSKFQSYRIILEKQKIVFHTLNLLDQRYNSMIGKIWITHEKRGLLFKLIPSVVTLRQVQTTQKPPTYFETNEFTAPFQQIVNTYGIPRYKEVNPALFAIPIFPFLFGVMFGDIGHGGAVLAFSIWLLKDSRAKQMLPDIYAVRYLFLLMGIFAFYSGWIYNEFFSIPLNVFGSCYLPAHHQQQAQKIQGCVYPFGFDPKWIRSSNELNYFNSYKMKFAVIIGVLQMTFAIFLKCLNTIHFKNYIDLFFQWLPQQIFFFCTFGYMSILIIVKWSIPWGIQRDYSDAPSIIGQMIALPLKMGSTEGKPLWDMESQQNLQYNLLMISLLCVPWMLIFKPVILWFRMPSVPHHEQNHHQYSLQSHLQDNSSYNNRKISVDNIEATRQEEKHDSGHHDEHDISQIAVHQIIQTIQFVLGTISNTASYLRLWALSLAHGQLSKVFLSKTIGGGISSSNVIIIVLGMYFFFNITIGVIMFMDTMQCFLHALRLQWVQFNSKFFKADGRKFNPLSIVNPIQAQVIRYRMQE